MLLGPDQQNKSRTAKSMGRPSSVSLRRPEIDTTAPRMDIKEWKKTAQRYIPGQPQGRPEMENQYDNGLPQRSLEVSDTLLHGGLDSSLQVTSKEPDPQHRL
jgi:hypothetical protein